MNAPASEKSLLAFATLGKHSGDEDRLLALLEPLAPTAFPFDRTSKFRSFKALLSQLRNTRPALAVMEGTGIAGGAALLIARALWGVRYVVSSGDAIEPFIRTRSLFWSPFFGLYERLLYRHCSGFIGWTPYLVGRALTYGAPRAMTAPGWASESLSAEARTELRTRVRAQLGIPPDALVFGLAGSLAWSQTRGYAYGFELVSACASTTRQDLRVLVVGDGDGLPRLREIARPAESRILFTGRVPRAEVPGYLAAMDVGCLPQSTDGVGSFRYSIKLPEYLACGLPIVTNEIPLSYDLDAGWLWRLPGDAPWDARFVKALAALMESLKPADVAARQAAIRLLLEFDREKQIARTKIFLLDILRYV